MEICRRGFLRSAATSFVAAGSATSALAWAAASLAHTEEPNGRPPFDVRSFGAVADGKTVDTAAVNRAIATGRIKCGTELSGGFKNIVIGNCVFENCRGFALESVEYAMRRFFSGSVHGCTPRRASAWERSGG